MRSVLSIGIILVSVALLVGFVKPRYSGTVDQRTQIEELDEALDNSRKLKEVWDNLLNRYNALEARDVERLRKMVPGNIDNVKMIIEIDSLATQLGLVLRSVEVERDEEVAAASQAYGSVGLSFEMEGSYARFVEFLERLEKSLRLVDVQEMGFKVSRDDDESIISGEFLEFDVLVQTYWLK